MVYGNGWELQLAKNKDQKVAAMMAAVGVTGPFFHSTLSAWMISTEKPRVLRQDEGEMALVPSPTRRQRVSPYDRSAPGPVPKPGPEADLAAQQQRNMYVLQQQQENEQKEKEG
jgi:hypothetical protein